MPMTCQNRGLFHLGISQEACENAGGRWYRSPCITLKQCIDDRPPRFQMDYPQTGSCQANLGKLNTAYVSRTPAVSRVVKVKIQLEGTNYLHMREVQVFDYNNVNVALNKPATQSSTRTGTWPFSLEASSAVDGNLTTISYTNNEQGKHQLFIKLQTLMSPLTPFCQFLISPQVLGGKWTWVRVLQCLRLSYIIGKLVAMTDSRTPL
jgi:hypothetical protein